MKYQSHVVIAISSIAVFHPWTDGLLTGISCFLLGILGGLFPDVDHPYSFFGSKIPVIPTILYKFDGHRGVTHSIFGMLVGAIFGVILVKSLVPMVMLLNMQLSMSPIKNELFVELAQNKLVMLSLGIGYASHLLCDLITNKGIPVLWPLRDRYVIKVTTTGSALERLIVLWIVFAGWGIGFLPLLINTVGLRKF